MLGEGGAGRVFAAHDPLLDRKVAIKVPRGAWWGADQVLAEARALARLAHPSIVQVLDAGKEGGVAYIVLEHVDGLSLDGLLARSRGTLEPAEAVALLRGAAQGIDHAHERGLLHRDLKPANLLAPLTGPALKGVRSAMDGLKVSDLGLAALAARYGRPARGAAPGAGDPRYTAPEAWLGNPSKSSDVFSLAAIFMRLVGGAPPLDGSPQELVGAAGAPERRRLCEVRPDAGAALDEALARALSPDVGDRPETASSLLDALESASAKDAAPGGRATPATAKPAPRRWVDSRAEAPERVACSSCHRPLHPRATACPHCGEARG